MICPMKLVYQEIGPQNWWVLMQAWRASYSVTADMKMSSALVFLLAPVLVLDSPFHSSIHLCNLCSRQGRGCRAASAFPAGCHQGTCFRVSVCSTSPQAQHLPPGMYGPAGAHVPAEHPRHQTALPALRHGAVVQCGHRRGWPGEQHPPDPVHHPHCALRPEHVSTSTPGSIWLTRDLPPVHIHPSSSQSRYLTSGSLY